MSAKLIAEDGLLKGLVLSLREGDQWIIGRDPDECQLLIEDPEASRKHVLCRKTPEGIILENLSSTNPAQVNNQPVTGSLLLHEGDAIKIGSGTFRFHQSEDNHPDESELPTEAPDVIQQVKELEKDMSGDESIVEEDEGTEAKEVPSAVSAKASEEKSPASSSLPEASEAAPLSTTASETPLAGETAKTSAAAEEPAKKEEAIVSPAAEQAEPSAAPENAEEPASPIHEGESQAPAAEAQPEVEAKSQPESAEPNAAEAQAIETQENPEPLPSEKPKEEAGSTESTVEAPMTALAQPEELDEKVEHEENLPFHEDETPDDTLFEEDEDSPLAEIDFNIKDTGRWMLKVVGGANNGAEFSLQPSSSYTIGTDPNACDIVFYDTSVSRTHARITIDDQENLFIEDLKSRNGTLVDGETLVGKQPLETNVIVTMGTTSFIVLDREGEMHTIISPLLPSIVKVLQKEDESKKAQEAQESAAAEQAALAAAPSPLIPEVKEDKSANLSAFILISIITGLFVLAGLGMATLFQSKPIVTQEAVDIDKKINDALMMFPGVKHSFNKSTGRLLLVGHVMTAVDRNQLLYNLQGLPFIKSLDDSGIVIDEYVWKEINQVLNKNPLWKGVTVHSPTAGHFVLSGYLETRKQGEQLSDYLSSNFPYLDLLEKRVIVEEDVVTSAMIQLQNQGIRDVKISMKEGQLILTGTVEKDKLGTYDKMVEEFAKIPGVRNIQNLVAQRSPQSAIEDISSRYQVGGFSSQGSHFSVVINGRILQPKDVLDGMVITEIKPHTIFLEKDGKKFRIDF